MDSGSGGAGSCTACSTWDSSRAERAPAPPGVHPASGRGGNAYLVRLAYTVFKDSMLFPFALTALGLSVIALGIQYQRNRQAIDARLDSFIPEWLREILPRTRFNAQYL
jgi:hypothetical protein